MARRAGRGGGGRGRGSPEDAGVSTNNLPAVCVSLVGFHPSLDPEPEDWGAGCGDGGGGRSRGLSCVLSGSPRVEGEGRQVGAGVAAEGVEARVQAANPTPAAGQLGARSSGSNRPFLNFPSVCWGGTRRADLGADFSRFALASRPTRLPPALRRGGGVEGALSARLGRRGES